jgi:hypothetical protein
MKMTLAKALQLKNRTARKIKRISDDMCGHNSIIAGNDAEVEVLKLDKERHSLVNYMVFLKTAIHNACEPVRDKIFRLSEAKASIAFYNSLPTRHGKAPTSRFAGGSETIEYRATIRKADVDRFVADLEKQIDQLQDELDAFNHETQIDTLDQKNT